MLVEGLYLILSGNATLQTLLGTSASRGDSASGIFPGMLPEETTMPAIVYTQVAGQPLQESMQGTGPLTSMRIRFSCYGDTYKKAKELGRVLNQIMISIDGTMPGPDAKAEVHGVWLRLDADDAEPIPHGTIYSNHRDYEINYLDFDV